MNPQQQSQPTVQDEVDPQSTHMFLPSSDPSNLELLSCLRHQMIISCSHILAHINLALKDETDNFSWVEFDPKFRSHLFKLAFSLLGKWINQEAQKTYKKAIFIYTLEILNQEVEDPLFTPKSGREKTAHTKWEKWTPDKPAPPANAEDHQHREDMDAQTGQQVEAPTPNKNTPTNQHIVTPPPAEPAITTEHANDTPTDPFENEVGEFLQKWTKTIFGEVMKCNGTSISSCGRPATHIHLDRSKPDWSYFRCEEHAYDCEPIPSKLLHNSTSLLQASKAKLQKQGKPIATPALEPPSNPAHPSPPQQNRKIKGHIQRHKKCRTN